MPGFYPFGILPTATLSPEDDHSIADPFWRLLQYGHGQYLFLVELYPFDSEKLVDRIWMPAPIGVMAFGQIMGRTLGAERVIRLSDHYFITEPNENPANEYFAPLVDNALQYDASLISGNTVGVNSPTFGALEIANGNGDLDYFAHLSWSGRRIVVKAGLPGFRYADYAVVFDGLCNNIEMDDAIITLTISDKGLQFDKEIIGTSYAGTGGLEGSTDLAGRLKPLAYGKCFNVEPVLVDALNLIYQVHNGQTQAVNAVFDAGVALTFDADYPSIAAATPIAGKYATCLATGHIKLGSTPAGRITLNLEGDKAGGYVSKVGDVCLRIVQTLYEEESLSLDDIDTAAWSALNSALSGDVGIYITERRTLRQLLDELLNPLAAYWQFSRFGLFSAAYIETNRTPTITIDDDMIGTAGAQISNVMAPAWRISVAYAPVWTVQAEDELAGGAPAAHRSFVGAEYRFTTSENRSLRTQNIKPLERTFYTNLADKSDADALLERLVRIYAVERKLYQLTVYDMAFRIGNGDIVRFKYPRFSIDAEMIVVSTSYDAETAATTLELWG